MNKVRIVSSGALVPLVQLCYSEDSRTVRNASGALLNLTHADKNRPALVRAGCLAVFVRLLRSPETDVQYFCAAALSNIAVDGPFLHIFLFFCSRCAQASTGDSCLPMWTSCCRVLSASCRQRPVSCRFRRVSLY